MEHDPAVAMIEDELRVGGRPMKALLVAYPALSEAEHLRLTNEALKNLEERLCRVEAELGPIDYRLVV